MAGREKTVSFFRKRLIQPLLAFLKQGITPASLALAVTLGSIIATFPVFGAHSLLCLLVIFLFRLNAAAVFLVNNFAYPLIFITYLPLIRMGEWLFNAPPLAFSLAQIFSLFEEDVLHAVSVLWDATMYAIVAWIIVAVPSGVTLYYVLLAVFRKLIRKQAQVSSS
jgi:uncharacterized protein (DUF2062 family)